MTNKKTKKKADVVKFVEQEIAREERKKYNREWWDIKHILGYDWAWFYVLTGSRCVGKSYAVMDYCCQQNQKHGTVFYWLRLNEASTRKMLANNAAQFVDPDLVRKYDLELKVKKDTVYNHDKPFAHVLALSTAASSKGSALFDKDFKGDRICVLDEFQLEKDQKRCFDIQYNLVIQLENIFRMSKAKNKIFMIANATEEISDILAMFNFVPEKFGIFKLKNKRCVIENMKPSAKYLKNREGSIGDILAGKTSNYTNAIRTDTTLIYKGRLFTPQYIIKFDKTEDSWFTVWNGNVIAPYCGERKDGFAMRRYIEESFNVELRDQVFAMEDARAFKYRNLIT